MDVSTLGLSAPYASALTLALVIVPFIWVVARSRSLFMVRQRLWRLLHRRSDSQEAWLNEAIGERFELMRFRALVMWADSLARGYLFVAPVHGSEAGFDSRMLRGPADDAIVYVDLSSAQNGQGIVERMAAAVGLSSPAVPTLTSLAAYINARRLTIAIDNFGHILSETTHVCGELFVLARDGACCVLAGRGLALPANDPVW